MARRKIVMDEKGDAQSVEQTEINDSEIQTNTVNVPQAQPQNEIENLLKGYSEQASVDSFAAQGFEEKKKRGRKPGQKNAAKESEQPEINQSEIIDGALLLLLINIGLPNLIAFINNRFVKTKIKASKLQLTDDEVNTIKPLADKVASQISMQANPMTMLIVTLIGMYAMKIMTARNE